MHVIASTVARLTAVAAVALGLAVAAPGGAQAKEKVLLDLSGYAAPSAPVGGAVSFAGFTKGDPDAFYGRPFTGTFGPDDGTRPTSRACEAASGTLTIGGAAGSVTLAVSGTMCEQFGSFPTFGEWTVTDADGEFAKAKGTGMFSWNAQPWGTLWDVFGDIKY